MMTNFQNESAVESTLETISIASEKGNVVLKKNIHFEAPNWSLDGSCFIINSNGLLYEVTLNGKKWCKLRPDPSISVIMIMEFLLMRLN